MAAVRQGSRWLYDAPTEDDVTEWFSKQPLHAGMEHGRYQGGIVLISAEETVKESAQKANGDGYIREAKRIVFVPYVKVDTRIAYFWDLVMRLNAEGPDDPGSLFGQFVGVIEPVPQRVIEDPASAYFNANLPDGFFMCPIANKDSGSFNRYIGCVQRVAIYERESYFSDPEKAKPIIQGKGTKQTLLAKNYADDNALMKAETSAVGRALGMAGILVVGTGVASAEDMQDASGGDAGPLAATGAAAATLPGSEAPASDVAAPIGGPEVTAGSVPPPAVEEPASAEQEDEALRATALLLQQEMQTEFPAAWEAYAAWWKERNFGPLATLTGPALKGAVVKLERELDAAQQAAQQAPPPSPAPDQP